MGRGHDTVSAPRANSSHMVEQMRSGSTSAPAELTTGVQAGAELAGAQGTPGAGSGKPWPEWEWRMTKDIRDP